MTVVTEIYSPVISRVTQRAPVLRRHAALLFLTLCTLLIHGYHPFAEDGGIYVAGVESSLNPSLFPHDVAFVNAAKHYSLFAPLASQIVRSLHIPLPWLLLTIDLAGTWLMLYASWRLAAQCIRCERARIFAAALMAAWFTLPIAGTSLLLMDPYVTARTFSTPLSLLAVAFATEFEWNSTGRPLLRSALCLAIATAFHPLMAAYAAGFVLTLLITKLPSRNEQVVGWVLLATLTILTAAVLQIMAPAEFAPTIAAACSRAYWFLSQWHWYEIFGLAGPLIVFILLLRFARLSLHAAQLCHASIVIGCIAVLISLLFANENYATHLVARLQPLRTFLLIYAVMIVLLGSVLADAYFNRSMRNRAFVPVLFLSAIAVIMIFAQRQTFRASQHLELPWRDPINPWSQAFVWARNNTPPDALFAIDANYITTNGEDSQTFRATAQRSILPDFSKDGGEAAIRPALADAWFAGQSLQKQLSRLTDEQRKQRLQPFGVSWLILSADTRTVTPCPYDNGTVKVCPLR